MNTRAAAGAKWSKLRLGLAVVLACLLPGGSAAADDTAKVWRVGVLAPAELRPIESFKERLHGLGWIEGQNVRFDYRWAEGNDSRYPALAAELVALPADLILTWGTPAVLAAKQATAKIPIVMAAAADPIGVGAVSSLAHPGGNVTGFSTQNLELEEKRFDLLRQVVPGMARIVMLGNAANPYVALAMKHVEGLAEAAGLKFDGVKVAEENGVESGLNAVLRVHPDAVQVAAATALFPYRRAIVEFMATNRLPAIYPFREFAEAGGLIAYSTNFDDLFRQAAGYVDRILRGASPGELPVQQAATFELLINLNTAKALGLTIAPPILARADEVIE
jgi:putative tryptophan/tyrosine transport system substrate-binding protein